MKFFDANDVQCADSGTYHNPYRLFPKHWGNPPVDDDERHEWIRSNCVTGAEYRRGAEQAAAESRRFWNGIKQLEILDRRQRELALMERMF